ncbi:hypothetical protein QBZ16_001303 [Prototheca wickerhamii]|uniref:Protein transport protein SEC13 n=1 Tax=Prototheca wickerhamii TaxID=3111 RepID=A0AAD9IGR6_PROWI|nr:hypothetical protein QBZ16_001303 [Prototheca wickerhamii]
MATSVITQFETGHQDVVHDTAFDYYGKRVATCSSDRAIKIFEIDGEQVTQQADLLGHEGPVWEVDWSHPSFGPLLASASCDGGRRPLLAAASSDGAVSVHSAGADGQWSVALIDRAHPPGALGVSWSPDGRRLASGGADGVARPTAPGSRDGPGLVGGHTHWVRDVAWAPALGASAATIATGGHDGKVLVWTQSPAGGWEHALLHDFGDLPVYRLSWAVSGSVLAVTDGSNAVSLWKEALEGRWERLEN